MNTLDLSFLTQEERDTILSVLQRDEDLKKSELNKKKIIQSEISQIKRASAIKVGQTQKSRECARCHTELGIFRNSGGSCPRCHHLICTECRHVRSESKTFPWLCTLCHKQRLLPAVTGDWYYDQTKHSTDSLNKENSLETIEATELIKTSIRTAPICERSGRSKSRENPFKNISPHDLSREITPNYADLRWETTTSNISEDGIQTGSINSVDSSQPDITHIKTKYHSSDSDSSDEERKTPNTRSEERLLLVDSNGLVGEKNPDVNQHKTICFSSSYDSSQLNSAKIQSTDRSVRPRSKSLTPLIFNEDKSEDDYTVEELTQTKFRRCSTEHVQRVRSRSVSSEKVTGSAENINRSDNSSYEQLSSNSAVSVNKPAVLGPQSTGPVPVPVISIIDDQDQERVLSLAEINRLTDEDMTCRSDGENIIEEDEDIDGLFAEAKQTHIWRPRNHSQISCESLTSVYSGAGIFGNHPITGDIELSWYYNENRSTLSIKVHSCRNLTAINERKNTSDPYVKIYLLPDQTKSSKHKTKVKKGTLNPLYNQSFSYQKLSKFQLIDRILQVSVWNFHRLGHSEFLGEVNFPLTGENLMNRNTPVFYPLHEKVKTEQAESRGEIHISIKYVLSSTLRKNTNKKSPKKKLGAGELHVNILSAKNLIAKKSNGASDPFVKCTIQPERDGKRSKLKTSVVKNNLYPSWNETLVFNEVIIDELSELCVEISVWDHDKYSSNDFLGAVRLNSGRDGSSLKKARRKEITLRLEQNSCQLVGQYSGMSFGDTAPWMDSFGKELEVWNEMVNNPDKWIDAWIPLRCSLSS